MDQNLYEIIRMYYQAYRLLLHPKVFNIDEHDVSFQDLNHILEDLHNGETLIISPCSI